LYKDNIIKLVIWSKFRFWWK